MPGQVSRARCWRGRVRLVLAAAVLAPILLVAVPGRAASDNPRAKVTPDQWGRIVREAEGEVSPRLLLGGPGSDPNLDCLLLREGISRDDFRRASAEFAAQAGPDSDPSTSQEFQDEALASVVLPSGVTPLPGAGQGRRPVPFTADDQAAIHRLVSALPRMAAVRSPR